MVSDWKKYRLSYTEKAEEILNKLTLEEKISLLSGSQTKEEVRGAIQKKIKMHYNEIPYRAGGIKGKGDSIYVFCGWDKEGLSVAGKSLPVSGSINERCYV